MVINRKRETDTERTERETDRMSATKYGGSGRFGKALFCNHYSKDQFRQQLAVDAKFKVGEWMTNRIYACLKRWDLVLWEDLEGAGGEGGGSGDRDGEDM